MGTSGPSGSWPGPGPGSASCPTGSPPARILPACRASATGSGQVPSWCSSYGGCRGYRRRRPPAVALPPRAAGRAAGYWWELWLRKVEVPRFLVFDAPRQARACFEALIADSLDLGRPENVEMLFKRSPRGRKLKDPAVGAFKTAID